VTRYVSLEHPRFIKAQRDIFVKVMVADCMTHRCRVQKSPAKPGARVRLDVCCQYGVDVDLGERDAILAHRDQIAAIMTESAASASWFDDEVYSDEDFPSGGYVRTEVHKRKCIFLAHEQRGCAIHRAALENGWDYRSVKPHVCRLFPLTYEIDAIVLSDDYPAYSCAFDDDAPSVYRSGRDALGDIFGQDLVHALDQAEAQVLGQSSSRMRVLRG
jgi:Fe-S-cluster containining protein